MLELTIDQKAKVTLVVTDRKGNVAQVDGAPEWETNDPAVATVAAAEDGMSAWVTAVDDGAGLTCNVTARVDADLGDGKREVVGVLAVAVTAGEVQFVELKADEPVEK